MVAILVVVNVSGFTVRSVGLSYKTGGLDQFIEAGSG